MQWSKLKNIILLILLVTNLFLLVLVLGQDFQSAQYREGVLRDTIEILAQDGIAVPRAILPKAPLPEAQQLSRDPADEEARAAALLGETTVTVAQTAPLSEYEGPLGSAQFRATGDFSVTLRPAAYPLEAASAPDHARTTLALLGIESQVLSQASQPDGVTVVTLQQTLLDLPVFSCTISAAYRDGALVSLSGRRLVGPAAPQSGTPPLTIATLLLRFRAGVIAAGDVCSAIQSITPGYELSAPLTGPNTLTPVLLVVTDSNYAYHLNALTGQLLPAPLSK